MHMLFDQTGWHHGCWVVLPILWLLIAAAVFALFWRRDRGGPRIDPAQQVLAERFARGEIDGQEYRDRLSQLQGDRK
jgi:putative membrane protein